MIYQVKWFNKKKGYGFVTSETGDELFCHHSDISVDGYKYLKRGEFVTGEVKTMDNGKLKLAQIASPMKTGKLMCEVERTDNRRTDREGDEE
jgi:CspA family cold shock protein